MRIVYLTNNKLGLQVLEHLKQLGESVVGLVVHPAEKRRYGDEIIACAGVVDSVIFEGPQLRDAQTIQAIEALKPDIAVSVMFGYILHDPLIRVFPQGVINLHPSYLPYNRGAYPNVWSIIDGTPAGATLHYIDEGVDTGDIIARKQVDVLPYDTGQSLYHKLESAAFDLFCEAWPSVRDGQAPRTAQPQGGTTHRVRDIESIDRIELDRPTTARELINLLRARTFPPYHGAYFEADNQRVYLRLELTPETDTH